MHGEVDLALEQRRLELLAEQTLAAELGQRPVDHPVAGGPHHHGLDGALCGQRGIGHGQRPADHLGLGARQRRAPRADTQRAGPAPSWRWPVGRNRLICCHHDHGL